MKKPKIGKLHKEFMDVINSLIKRKIGKEPIQAIILGGSVAREDETNHSDIDIVFYIKGKDLPKNPRKFYKFRGKYIEEHYFPFEKLKSRDILPEAKILYDKSKKLKIPKFNENLAKANFKEELVRVEKYQKLAEKQFKQGNLENSFNYLYGNGSPAFILIHALPQRFNLPFPSFRLLGSLKKIDKEKKSNIYRLVEKFYSFNNKNKKQILRDFKKAYLFMNHIKRNENNTSCNLGFFDKCKIKYNFNGLKLTFKDYPFVYSYRFIVGCLAMWAFEDHLEEKIQFKLREFLLKVLGLDNLTKELIQEKLKLSRELVKESKKIK